MMKPLLLMRKKGLASPMFAKHCGIGGLSKSIGGFIGLNTSIRITNGWTGTENCAVDGSPYTVKFSAPVYFTSYAGINFYNVTQDVPGTGITSALDQGVTEMAYTVNWAFPVEHGDVVELRYSSGDYGDLPVGDPERELMADQTITLVNCSVITFLTSNGDTFITSDGDTFTVGGA